MLSSQSESEPSGSKRNNPRMAQFPWSPTAVGNPGGIAETSPACGVCSLQNIIDGGALVGGSRSALVGWGVRSANGDAFPHPLVMKGSAARTRNAKRAESTSSISGISKAPSDPSKPTPEKDHRRSFWTFCFFLNYSKYKPLKSV